MFGVILSKQTGVRGKFGRAEVSLRKSGEDGGAEGGNGERQ